MFGWFESKKKENISDMLAGYLAHQQLIGQISKIKSLQKLNRQDEARQLIGATEDMAKSHIAKNANDKNAHVMLAHLYCETGLYDKAEPLLEAILKSFRLSLDEQEKLILSGELQRIQRQRPVSQRAAGEPYTQIYSCANCGRLHNYVSVPCPYCDWSPKDLQATAQSMILSNAHFKVPALLMLAREIANGRSADDVVPNLVGDGKNYLANPASRSAAEKVYGLLREHEHKNHRSIGMLRECPACGERITFSGADKCEHCENPINWPDAIRALACFDNILWLFENRFETSTKAASKDSLSDFICVLVSMTNELLRKQEAPSPRVRQYALQLLSDIGYIIDLGTGGFVTTEKPQDLNITMIKDSMRDDTEVFVMFWYTELGFFVGLMSKGIRM